MQKYHRLSLEEREEISRLLANQKSFREIAKQLGRNVSTISLEVNQPGFGRIAYRATVAQKRAVKKRKFQGRKVKLDSNQKLKEYVFERLQLCWSPKQIAEKIKMDYPEDTFMRVSPETIYHYIHIQPKGELKKQLIWALRQQHKHRYRKGRRMHRSIRNIPNLISIDERPKEAESRVIPGHWEGDLMVGKLRRSALGSLVERTSRFLILVPLAKSDHQTVADAFAREISPIPLNLRKTLTYNRGGEMSSHELFTEKSQVKVYFAHSKSPWERGSNENTNGLVRQFFPKYTDFSKVTRGEIKKVQQLLNQRPRKTLNWETPEEVFSKLMLR
jgi:transposase, IS30 family